jgi:hypothetical protein
MHTSKRDHYGYTVRQAIVMRCVACGVDMELVRAVPDNSMMVSGREIGTFECPRCHAKAQRLMSTHEIEPFASERMQLPAISSALLATTMHKMSLAQHKMLVAARNALARALTMFRGSRDGGG